MTADVHAIREGLLQGRFKSIDLVNFYGKRCQTIGRELCYSTEELFTSALQKAA